jgi:hypothetical protein
MFSDKNLKKVLNLLYHSGKNLLMEQNQLSSVKSQQNRMRSQQMVQNQQKTLKLRVKTFQ